MGDSDCGKTDFVLCGSSSINAIASEYMLSDDVLVNTRSYTKTPHTSCKPLDCGSFDAELGEMMSIEGIGEYVFDGRLYEELGEMMSIEDIGEYVFDGRLHETRVVSIDCACGLSDLEETLYIGLYAGALAENLFRSVSLEMSHSGSDNTIIVALNELRNVCSCIADAVFVIEESAKICGVALRTDCVDGGRLVTESSSNIEAVKSVGAGSLLADSIEDRGVVVKSDDNKVVADYANGRVVNINSVDVDSVVSESAIGRRSNLKSVCADSVVSESADVNSDVSESAGNEPDQPHRKSSSFWESIHECTAVCEHFRSKINALFTHTSVLNHTRSDILGDNVIVAADLEESSGLPPLQDCMNSSTVVTATLKEACDLTPPRAGNCSNAIVATMLKEAMCAMESALASLYGIAEECVR